MKPFFEKLPFLICLGILFVFFTLPLQAQTPLWGPETVTRETGQPTEQSWQFSAPDPTWEYKLVVIAGDDTHRVSAGEITINDQVIVDSSEFNQSVSEITKTISLQLQNEMEIWIAGKPGSQLSVSISGPSTTGVIGDAGGILSLSNVAHVTFPPGSVISETVVSLSVSADPRTQDNYFHSSQVYGGGPSVAYEVRLNMGGSEFLKEPEIRLVVPPDIADKAGQTCNVQAFVQAVQYGGMAPMDNFITIPATYETASRLLVFNLPVWSLTDTRTDDQTFEAIVTIGCTPSYQEGGQE